MTIYVQYKISSGEIVGQGSCDDSDFEHHVPPEGYALLAIDSFIDVDSNYVKDDEIVPCARRPTIFYHLENGVWVLQNSIQCEANNGERIQLLNKADWMTTRHRDQRDAGEPTSLTEEQYSELLAYKQALRNWPVSGNMLDPLPPKPGWMN